MELPSSTLELYDRDGARLGVLRLAATSTERPKGDCIFDVDEPRDGAPDEVRWLYKRRYVVKGEHRWRMADDGALTVSQGGFQVVFEPDDDGLHTRPPAPPVRGVWA